MAAIKTQNTVDKGVQKLPMCTAGDYTTNVQLLKKTLVRASELQSRMTGFTSNSTSVDKPKEPEGTRNDIYTHVHTVTLSNRVKKPKQPKRS